MRVLFELGREHPSGRFPFRRDDHLTHRQERSTMNGAGAMTRQPPQMSCRTIPLMREKIIFREHFMVPRHETISRDFGDDGGSRNREREGVSLDDGPFRDPDSRKSNGINQ